MLVFENAVELRPYQEEALAATWSAWERGKVHHPLIVLPTGAGKSLTMAELCRRAMAYSGTRICVLAHRGELIQQNAEAIEQQTGQRVGVYAASLKSKETCYPVTVASIQSIYKQAPSLDPFDLVIIDEAHRIPPSSDTRYRRFLDEVALQNPNVRFIGFTATPFRMGTGRLDEGEDALFDGIVYEASVADLIRDGYLSEVVSRGGVRKIDTSGVKIRGGEYVAKDLAAAADKPDVTRAAVEEIVELGADRRGWLIFATGIDHAHHIAEEVRSHGVTVEVVTGDTPAAERGRTIEAFKNQQIRALVSVEVFLEGFNAPHVDLIGMMRPTKSPVLYAQCVGRGMRLYPGKSDCLFLDYAGVVAELGPVDMIRISSRRAADGEAGGEAPAKECPECHLISPAGVRECPCGYEYPPPVPKLNGKAYGGAVLSYQSTQEMVEVTGVRYSRWQPRDPSRPDTLLITYTCGIREVREWLCPEHTGYARTKFEHRARTEWGFQTAPRDIDQVLEFAEEGVIPPPVAIVVRPHKDNPKWLDIVRRFYPEPEADPEPKLPF